LVYYAVKRKELATYVRRFLRQPQFNTQAKRMGKIIQVTPHQISVWALGQNSPEIVNWTSKV